MLQVAKAIELITATCNLLLTELSVFVDSTVLFRLRKLLMHVSTEILSDIL